MVDKSGLAPFSKIADAPVHWGWVGRPGTRWAHPTWLAKLNETFNDLWVTSGLGPAEVIVSGGAYPGREDSKDDPNDRHWQGKAFDLVAIHWKDVEPLRAGLGPRDAGRYIGTESILRIHLPQVLGWFYGDTSHKSHWHCDDKLLVDGFQPTSYADVAFLQAALHYVWGINTGSIDGKFGPRTCAASTKALDQIGQPEVITQIEVWRAFLRATARGGWGQVELVG